MRAGFASRIAKKPPAAENERPLRQMRLAKWAGGSEKRPFPGRPNTLAELLFFRRLYGLSTFRDDFPLRANDFQIG